jgi:hypothetical protein
MKNNLVYLADYLPHTTMTAVCPHCLHAWAAVFPVTARELVCPFCGNVSRIPFGQPVVLLKKRDDTSNDGASMMKHYLGVIALQAKPMTRGEYNEYRGWSIPKDENPVDPGYLVKYSDSYEAWSPKTFFESAYFEMGEDPTTITPGMVDHFIGDNLQVSQLDEKTTLLSAKTITGFRQYETSSCVDPDNYDENIGREICLERVKNTVWLCLGFMLQWAKNGLRR